LTPILLRFAYGLLGFSKSEVVDTSAREENERALPPKNFESPGLLQNQQKKRSSECPFTSSIGEGSIFQTFQDLRYHPKRG
jgi:hypothetical protein